MVNTKTVHTKRRAFILALIIVALAVGGWWLWQRTQPKKSPATYSSGKSQDNNTGVTSKKPAEHNLNTTSTKGQGGAIDNNGQSSSSALPPKSAWHVSSDGNITLQIPSSGDKLSSGDQIAGTAKVDKVQFMLIDDSVGLLAQGELKVVSGKFAGELRFGSQGHTGRLDVYYPDPSTGAEKSLVEIPIKF